MQRSAIAIVVACSLIGVSVARGAAAAVPTGVLYTRGLNGSSEIWALDERGGDGHRLLAAAATPAWSPDGTRIAFSQSRSPDPSAGGDLATARPDGSELRFLTADGRSGSPAWSPDGARIAFVQRADQLSIALIGSSGGTTTQLTHPPAGQSDNDPAWSPDGRTIAFTRRGLTPVQTDPAIWTVDVATGAESQRSANGFDASAPAWSPDGTRIAFVSSHDRNGRTYGEDETTPNAEIYLMRSDGSSPTRVTHTRGPETDVSWSADGSRLLYAYAPAGSGYGPYELVASRADGACPTVLTRGRAWHLEPAVSRTSSLDTIALDCAPRSARVVSIPRADARAGRRVHGGRPSESRLARTLLAELGSRTTIRSITIAKAPAGRAGAAGASWLRLVVTGTATRNAASAVRPSWEAMLLADRYAARAAPTGARPLLGFSVHYLGSGRTISTTEAAHHEFAGTETPNPQLSAAAIERSLRATALPVGVALSSVEFARLDGGSAPEIVLTITAKSAAGRLFRLSDLLLDPLQLDQGAYVELRGRCGALIGAIGSGDLGTRQRVGTQRARSC